MLQLFTITINVTLSGLEKEWGHTVGKNVGRREIGRCTAY